MNNTQKLSVAVLVPAHNEEKIISKTLEALLCLVSAQDLYVVDDGSTDDTSNSAKDYTDNVLIIPYRGKAYALNTGIEYFNLCKKYEYIFFMDADSRPKADFLEQALKHFENDPKKEIVCVIGRVKVSGKNWIAKYRQWEYQVSYLIHKRAQEYLGSILVTPGCATVYRSFIFKKLKFPSGTLTEDMDFTFSMHRAGFNKMIFENKAIVYTLDPQSVKDFVIQLNRWYTGFWQVVRKHDVPWKGQMLDFEVAMLALEGLYNGLLVLFFLVAVVNLTALGGISILVVPLMFDLFLFFIPSLLWSMASDKDYSRILYIPHFYFLRFLSSILFLKSFFSGLVSLEKEYIWDSKRYVGKEGI